MLDHRAAFKAPLVASIDGHDLTDQRLVGWASCCAGRDRLVTRSRHVSAVRFPFPP